MKNEPCPTCGGPCKTVWIPAKDNPKWVKPGYDTLHDTLVQQAVDEAVRYVYRQLAGKRPVFTSKQDRCNDAVTYIRAHHPNAIPKDGE